LNRPAVATVLVVDDHPTNLELAAAMLELSGLRVLCASTAEQALAMAREARPDVVLMDVQLPLVDGLQATRWLKVDPVTADIPVVAFTAYAMAGDESRFREAGCDGCITKPIEMDTFAKQVLGYLRAAPAAGSA
jgi:two-component system, cell cycle response regulator DivK